MSEITELSTVLDRFSRHVIEVYLDNRKLRELQGEMFDVC